MLRRILPRLVVALLCAAALLQAARPAVYSVRQGLRLLDTGDPGGESFLAQQEYIGAELHRQIPAGTRAAIAVEDVNWRLRTAELATLQGIVVVGEAWQVEVRLEFDSAAPHGVRVLVRPVGG